MATVYSLVCWGGRTGKTVTFTDTGDVVNSTNHGLRTGTRLRFSTTGALPTGLSIVPAYYVGQGADASKFLLYTTLEDAVAGANQVTFSGAGSGTHTAQSVLMTEYFAQYPGRWGDAGSERCYDSIASWHTARTAVAQITDVEYCEIGQAFTEYAHNTSGIVVNMAVGSAHITTRVNGVYSEAFHFGQVSDNTNRYGFVLERTNPNGHIATLSLTNSNSIADGFTVMRFGTAAYSAHGFQLAFGCMVMNCIATSVSLYGNGFVIASSGPGASIVNCLAIGYNAGFNLSYSTERVQAYNCIATKCNEGFSSNATSSLFAIVYNCIAVGNNTVNWKVTAGFRAASHNLGGTGEAWVSSGGTRYEVTETAPFSSLFADWANNDLRPASASSPQVDTGIDYYTALPYDISFDERPNYNNGGAEAFDVGCYEFDHGYGNHPATATISLTNIVSGSRVLITRDDTSAVLYNDVPGSSLNLSTGYIGNFSVVIRKASETPYYREFSAGGTTVANQTTSIKALQQLDE